MIQQMRMILPTMRADFLERVRSYRFIAMLLFSVVLTYFFLPGQGAVFYANLAMGPARPIYSSAAIGSMTALLMAEFFTLFAFYLVKGNIERDRQTRVGQIIATTPISRATYMLGKWLSNLAVITAMVAGIILAAALLQLVRGEDLHIDLWAIAAPFVIILLPALSVVAGVALLFESINLLRGGLGNVLYLPVLMLLFLLPVDFEGINVLYPSLYHACAMQFSGCVRIRTIDLSGRFAGLPTFSYAGVPWTWEMIAPRLLFVLAGALIALLAALFFHRFDPARSDENPLGGLFRRAKEAAIGFVTTREEDALVTAADIPVMEVAAPARVELSARLLRSGDSRLYRPGPFLRALGAEWRLAFKGIHWLWYTVALALLIGELVVQEQYLLLVMLPLAWIWPLTIWSGAGAREIRHGTEQLVFSTPHPVTRQLAAAWLVGVLVAAAMAGGIIARLVIAGQWLALLPVLVGALFVPSFALAAGSWTGGSKLFEAAYLFFWYMASVHGVPVLDFMGRIPAAQAQGVPWLYAGLTIALAAAAVAGRLRSLTS